jgi:hypothetical protein
MVLSSLAVLAANCDWELPAEFPRPATALKAADVPAETPKERRARLLAWHDEEATASSERGAVARVTMRETRRRKALGRTAADRSNVGRDIAKGREERDAAKRAGPFAALGA